MNNTLNIMEKKRVLKKITTTPSVYSVVLDLNGRKFLYSGVHTSLEEAVSLGKKMAHSKTKTASKKTTEASLLIWNILSGEDALRDLTVNEQVTVSDKKPSVLFNIDECKKSIADAQSRMMQLIMKDGNSAILEENKPFLSKSSYRYVKERIK
jgi:hypothetical protein